MAKSDLMPRRMPSEEQAAHEAAIDWSRIDALTDEQAEANTTADPDAGPIPTEAQAIAARVRMIRKRSGLPQPEFAERYRIAVGTLRDWEQGRSRPDGPALAYLLVIDREPDAVVRALAAKAA